LLDIIALSEKVLGMEDLEIEVEYQAKTIGKYELAFNGQDFVLHNKQTNCLAHDSCGIQSEKLKVNISQIPTSTETSCTPSSGCC
jgi:hypothetical protein